MPSYSGPRFRKEWIYCVGEDFQSTDGTPATWAPDHPKHNGEEDVRISIPSGNGYSIAVNADETLIAVGIKSDIYVYCADGEDKSPMHVLKGHMSCVDVVKWHPQDADLLVTCAMNHMGPDVSAPPEIFFWDLKQERHRNSLASEHVNELADTAVSAVVGRLDVNNPQHLPWTMSPDDKKSLTGAFQEAIDAHYRRSLCKTRRSLHGRLCGGFGSHIFNSHGTSLAFLPGERPESNVDDKWDVCIYDLKVNAVRLTLVGHRDAIMWTGFSPDDRFIATISWDKTFRFWSHTTGDLLHTFYSSGQNWTGEFSPNSQLFAATSGRGQIFVWDLTHGIEVVSDQFPGDRWCRTLDWSPDGKQLAIGGDDSGQLIVIDLKKRKVVQNRKLSFEKMLEEVRGMATTFVGISDVQYMEEKAFGKKLIWFCTGEGGVEMYDFASNMKWRFAPKDGEDDRPKGMALVSKTRMVVTLDDTTMRFWRIPEDG